MPAGRMGAVGARPASVALSAPPVAGYYAWYDAADTASITASSNAVSQWNDKSGSGRHLTQGTAGSRPTSGLSTLNGRNIVTFDGGDTITAATAADWTFMNNSTQYTLFIVANVTDAGSANPALCGTTKSASEGRGFDVLLTRSTSALRHSVSAAVDSNVVNNSQASAITLGTAFMLSVVSDAGNATAALRSTFRVDGGTDRANNAATATPSALAPPGALTLGGRRNNDTTTRLTGSIAEVVIYDSALGSTDRASVESYLRVKWGTP